MKAVVHPTEHAVDLHGVSHRYDERPALRDVSLRVGPGHLFGLLGPNGSGKTTLFRILSTLLAPSAGTASLFGYDTVRQAHTVRPLLGMVFQQPALDEALTVRENLRFQGALYGLKGPSLTARIDALAAPFGLADRLDDRVGILSGGLQRRADLARGLLHAPRVLLLDEPTNGLDPAARHTFWNVLDRLRCQEGTTMVVATHLMEEADRCDDVAILHGGQLVAQGTPEALKQAIGEETLWLEARDPRTLCDHIQAQFGLSARVLETAVQITHPEAHVLLGTFYEAFGSQIESATVRRPTLEDVFLLHAGQALYDGPPMAEWTDPTTESV